MTFRVLRHHVLDSTQLEARRLLAAAAAPPLPFAVVATSQAGGRGREGKRWHSPAGGLWVTGVWQLQQPADPLLGLRVGLAASEALAEFGARGSAEIRLKWPNDVMLGDAKVAGVLTETVVSPGAQRVALVGVGVNANVDRADLPQGLAGSAAVLSEACGDTVDLNALLERLLGHLSLAIGSPLERAELVARAMHRLHARGEIVTLRRSDRSTATGTLLGLDAAGEPLLVGETGQRLPGPFAGFFNSTKASEHVR